MQPRRGLQGNGPSWGAIYTTTNGGTVWSAANIQPYTAAQLTAAVGSGLLYTAASSLINMYAMPTVGALFDVQSCSMGKYVFAVGAPGATAMVAATFGATPPVVTWAELSVPTILFSANSGTSWCAAGRLPTSAQLSPFSYAPPRPYLLPATGLCSRRPPYLAWRRTR